MTIFQKEFKSLLPLKDIQFFADGDNNDLPVRVYQRQFKELLTAVFNHRSYFADFSVGGIEALDGVSNNEEAFVVKTSDIPAVVGSYSILSGTVLNPGGYSLDGETAFSAGTSNTSRFGARTEIIYTNTSVPYSDIWGFHEGIDQHTVNNDMNAAIADRLNLQAQKQAAVVDTAIATYLNAQAGGTQALATVDTAGLTALFTALDTYYTDLEVVGQKVFKCTPAVYNAIVQHPLAVREKGSTVDIDSGTIVTFYDFRIEKVPTSKLPTGTVALVYVPGIGKTFSGISTTRTINSEDFDGVALQGAGKFGNYITNDNKKAVVKVTFPTTP